LVHWVDQVKVVSVPLVALLVALTRLRPALVNVCTGAEALQLRRPQACTVQYIATERSA
jgi:hypothetical protein